MPHHKVPMSPHDASHPAGSAAPHPRERRRSSRSSTRARSTCSVPRSLLTAAADKALRQRNAGPATINSLRGSPEEIRATWKSAQNLRGKYHFRPTSAAYAEFQNSGCRETESCMAQKINVLLVDDIDGSDAAETVQFGLDGTQYEIDLSSEHAEELRALATPYVKRARKTAGSGRG